MIDLNFQERLRACITIILNLTLIVGFAVYSPAGATEQGPAVGKFDAEATQNIEQIVHDYILKHPEVILESMKRLQQQQQEAEEQKLRDAAAAVKPVHDEDHILGNKDAPVKVIEFSDFECPFCKRFHATMKQLMQEYGGENGKVAWVFRHFPIDELHSKARKEAQAAECANELGGSQAFWAFADKLFAVTPSNNRMDLEQLPKLAEEIGLDRARFETCLEGDSRGGKYAAHIEENVQDAIASGGTGTPYTLVIAPNGQKFPINGAQPYQAVKSIVDLALHER